MALGNWQTGRAEEKRALGARLERALEGPAVEIGPGLAASEKVVGKRVVAHGHFIASRTILLDNKLRHGRPGYEVVTPLRLDGTHVLVNRGWIGAGRTRDELPQVATPAGAQRVEGLALARLPQALAAGEASGAVRQNLDIARFQEETGLRLQPIVIEQHSALPDGLLRDWPRPDLGADKHAAYALQWYSLAGLALVLFIVLSFRRVRPS